MPNQNTHKTRCVRGHALERENLYLTADGRRVCRECRRIRKRSRRQARIEAAYLERWAEAIEGAVARVPLAGSDRSAIIDSADVEAVSAYSWRLANGYAKADARDSNGERRYIYMHRLLLDPPDGCEVDHANRDRLDNRRTNLRSATRAQQMANQGVRSNNTSGYRGVSRTRSGRWGAWIRTEGRSRTLGGFDTAEQAALAYNRAATEAWGEFASLNEVS